MANHTADGLSVPVVDIDDNGTFKYVLLKVNNTGSTYLVRGHKWADYHDDLVQECKRQLRDNSSNVSVKCVGGGRIQHDRDQKIINVYGYSVEYGQANHADTCKILKTHYNDYTIEWSNDGY